MSFPIPGLIGDYEVAAGSTASVLRSGRIRVTGNAKRWWHVVRFRLQPGVVPPSAYGYPFDLQVSARVHGGRISAVCLADDLSTVLGRSVEWGPEDGTRTLTVPAYSFPGQGWLVFRTTATDAGDYRFTISTIKPFARVGPLPGPAVESRIEAASELQLPEESALRSPRPIARSSVIYTAITNQYDTLAAPQRVEPDCDYVCFTDNPEAELPRPWIPRPIGPQGHDPRMQAKWYKVHPHLLFPSHDLSVWVDGRVRLTGGVLPLARYALSGSGFAVFQNPWVDCIYHEAEDVRQKGWGDPSVVDAQMQRYRRAGMPRHALTFCGGVIMRSHHDARVVRTMQAWWSEIEAGSTRDQLSLGYVLWKRRLRFTAIDMLIFDNPYFQLGEHN